MSVALRLRAGAKDRIAHVDDSARRAGFHGLVDPPVESF